MSRKITIMIFCLVSIGVFGQRPSPDQIQTKAGPLIIQPILHGTVVLTWNGKTIYVDPYGGAKAFAGIAPPDLILITDIHGDHLNAEHSMPLKRPRPFWWYRRL